MEFLHWFDQHGYDVLEAFAIVASLGFTTASFRREERSRNTANLLTIIAAHRDIWSQLFERPELARVLKADLDLELNPVTVEEALFVTLVTHHLNGCVRASHAGMFEIVGTLENDVRAFFSLPIPSAVWKNLKSFQNKEFVDFVENCLR